MTHKTFWYLTEALALALYITFFAIIANNIWFGIIAGIGAVIMRKLTARILDKVKVGE